MRERLRLFRLSCGYRSEWAHAKYRSLLEGLPTQNVLATFSLNPEVIAYLWEGKWAYRPSTVLGTFSMEDSIDKLSARSLGMIAPVLSEVLRDFDCTGAIR